ITHSTAAAIRPYSIANVISAKSKAQKIIATSFLYCALSAQRGICSANGSPSRGIANQSFSFLNLPM
ncbi:MAG: hypothetical protein RR287_00300, partial [Oscillospiraceae bacterium]